MKKYTIGDLTKKQLVSCIDAIPQMARIFTEEAIAGFAAEQKMEEHRRIGKKIKVFEDAIIKARNRKKKNDLAKAAYPLVVRYNAIIDQLVEIKALFPELFKEEKN